MKLTPFSTKLCSSKQLMKLILYFFGIIIFWNIFFNLVQYYFFKQYNLSLDIPLFWPISVFTLRFILPRSFQNITVQNSFILNDFSIIIIFLNIIFFTFILYNLNKIKKPLQIYLIGAILIILTTLIQGLEKGFIYPINGGGLREIQYFHDAIKINDPYLFISNFNNIQLNLLTHSRTHPPGAVLFFYFLEIIFQNPLFISIILLLISLCSIFFIYNIFRDIYDEKMARYISLIFIFIPAIQIYYIASLDSFIAFIFLGIIYYYLQIGKKFTFSKILLFIAFIGIGTFLTYLVFFPLIVIYIDSFMNKKYKLILFILSICIFFIILFDIVHYNYLESFLLASKLENSSGFLLLINPITYLSTRLEDIFEIIIFFGPLTSLFAYFELKRTINELIKKFNEINLKPTFEKIIDSFNIINQKPIFERLSYFLITILLLFFLAGGFRTGETARGCIFIYPFLLTFVAKYFWSKKGGILEIRQLLIILWVQTLLMQIVGFYFW